MKNDSSRFSYEIVGFFRSVFYRIRYPSDWPKRVSAWVTDHERSERFQLSEEEDHLMMVLGENLGEIRQKHGGTRYSSVWTQEKNDAVVDHVLIAIVNKRKGDTSEWERLKAMTEYRWYEWLEDQLVREKP